MILFGFISMILICSGVIGIVGTLTLFHGGLLALGLMGTIGLVMIGLIILLVFVLAKEN